MTKATESGFVRAREAGRKPGKRVAFPETLNVGLSAGWLARLSEAAAREGMNRAEYVRRCLRRGLDASRKLAAREASE